MKPMTLTVKRAGNKLKAFFSQPSNIILTVALILLGATTIFPLISMIIESFTVHLREALFHGEPAGSISLSGWKSLLLTSEYNYSKNYFYVPLFNSISMALIASAVAIVIGGVFAWFINRTNIPLKKPISALLLFPYIMPSWTIALFWHNMFANVTVHGCSANGIIASLFHIYAPEWFVYGRFPIGMTLGIHYAPFAYILIGGILKNMDANLEEAATILKTPRWRILTKITLPIVAPAMMNTFLLVFASSVSAYAVPVFLGTPIGFMTLTTSMTYFNQAYPAQGYAVGIVLVVLGLFVLGINNLFTGKRKSYTTVTGKSSQVSFINLKAARQPFAAAGLLIVFAISILPMITFALESVLKSAGNYTLGNMSFHFWIGDPNSQALQAQYYNWEGGILVNAHVWSALGHSLLLSLACALIAGTCGLLVGYAVVNKRHSKLSKIVSTLAFIPYLIPSMAFGMAYLALSVNWSFLYGSFFLLVLVGAIKYMPFATKSATGAMLQLSGEIEEAAILTNTPWWKRMLKIIFPIQKPSFLSGYLLPFISCMRELSLFVLLIVDSNFITTTLLMYYNEKGYSQYGNALNLLIVIIVLLINWVVNKLTGASVTKGVGGK